VLWYQICLNMPCSMLVCYEVHGVCSGVWVSCVGIGLVVARLLAPLPTFEGLALGRKGLEFISTL
jgi:hypothetical protein